ncbi:SDR family NAD(P)-dependent oxidoreductase [Algoriphagus sp. D3-2-R+10]|uniref:SDR family oxidoreductase n=1 Tax=Algoriphagus aurantiacus TaxID=3103948 RepID=UPI002B3BCF32|nr:SDR family NAD(P)-dependent oxidoreductase [Algoriphagus sp. D3-2-R+10]MEB2775001.1 SDR family NAD(P)-dependent oxidoreductase [Algoriphagus sp. D3-2-R+10]
MKIEGKTILITGGSAGIGLEAARQFLAKGAKVIITGRDQKKLDKAKSLYPALLALKSDVANREDAEQLFTEVSEMGGIDILYNNAGVMYPSENLGMSSDKHEEFGSKEMEVNYLGVVRLNNLFMDMLKSKPEAAIINTTSILSYVPSLLEVTYSASKVALRFYTESLREHLRILNSSIKVFELLPPLVATEMTASKNDKMLTTEALVKGLVKGLEKDNLTIRVGDTKAVYFMSRLAPKKALGLVNPKKAYKALQ